MVKKPISPPNPRRVAAGRRNWLKRGPRTPAGRERLRQSTLKNKPWLWSTDPRTPEGKAKVAANGRKHQKGEKSVRQLRASVADVRLMVERMVAGRTMLESTG